MPLTTARLSSSRLSVGAVLVGLALIVAPRDAGAVERLANGGFDGIGSATQKAGGRPDSHADDAALLPGWTADIEPATWTLTIGGFGIMGAILRRSRAPALVRA